MFEKHLADVRTVFSEQLMCVIIQKYVCPNATHSKRMGENRLKCSPPQKKTVSHSVLYLGA